MNRSLLKLIDWFVPDSARLERVDASMARNFVFTHLFGPLLSQAICIYLYRTDTQHGFACWTMITCVWLFWTLPFVYKLTENLQLSALLSVELLAFTSLFGTYAYGGVNSPFLPWLIVDLLLGFFYLSDRPVVVIQVFILNILILLLAYYQLGFPEIVTVENLTTVGWISILSATIYMSWMAIYYANIMAMSSAAERETEYHRLTAEKLKETKALAEAANHARSIFVSKMSHELRTPLNAVIGYSELILESIDPDTTSQAKINDLQCINQAGKHLLSLVNEVLDMSKIEADKEELSVETFSLDALIDQVVATSQPLMTVNRNIFRAHKQPDLGLVETDQTKLRQVLFNLLGNAAKFTREGEITLLAKRERHPGGDWLEIQVRDTGVGLSRADIAKLFQNFKQVAEASSGKFGGTGLGLALSQRLCALMGGGITVSSEVGLGSRFTVRLPARIVLDERDLDTTSFDPVFPDARAAA